MDKIKEGYYIKSRKIQESKIAHAPPHVREIWDWLLREANYKNNGIIKRGQTIRSYKDIQEGLHWMVGYRKERYTKWQIKLAIKWLTNEQMIVATKTTRGMVVTVCNYDYYQTPENYESHKKATMEPHYKQEREERVITIAEAKKSFDKFRKLYPGTKRGLDTEFESFIKKHSDWAEIAPTLNSTLEKLIQSRQKKKERGEFIPEWKHLQTWINQRCWEEESGEDVGNAPVLKFNSTSNLGFYFTDANPDTLYVVRKKEVAIGFIDTEKYFPDLPDDTLMIAFKHKKGGLFTKYLGVAPLDESGQVIKELKKIRECLKRVS